MGKSKKETEYLGCNEFDWEGYWNPNTGSVIIQNKYSRTSNTIGTANSEEEALAMFRAQSDHG